MAMDFISLTGRALPEAKEIVLKAQILAGGRGKGIFNSGLKGGVHLTKDPKTVEQLAKQMIGYNLSTKQTPKDGVTVKKVMVAEALDISRETYFAILMDRACNGPVMVGSPQGGVDIEEVAVTSPELIFKEEIDIFEGVKDHQALQMAKNLGFQGPLQQKAADQIKKLYNLFLKIDATQVEVNPFGETPEGQVVCFDAKINFDDNAEFRQKEIFAMDDKSESEPIENEAAKYDLKYIGLDGNIACFVNGAGLAMATCDIISLNGGKPANFLDLGGGVKEAQVYQAFKLLTADPKSPAKNHFIFEIKYKPSIWKTLKVEAILVNIFGGIVNCAIIANGITKACQELELKVPLVVRLEEIVKLGEKEATDRNRLLHELSAVGMCSMMGFGDWDLCIYQSNSSECTDEYKQVIIKEVTVTKYWPKSQVGVQGEGFPCSPGGSDLLGWELMLLGSPLFPASPGWLDASN
ncbi:Succinyl-CoA ligase [GDP-forming] subunit beta [Turdus rufiventris]|nr:Succinyl-CoA ligase [GDP-forming] subunit beta [Turdus rufiventris]